MTLLPLCAYLQTRKGQATGIQFILNPAVGVKRRKQ
jgi:hypothetical protein